MNIFADYHHGDLYYSLYLLFEKRLGHKLFRPIGMDWFRGGYWKIGDPYHDPSYIAMQYLSTVGYKGEFPANADYYVEDDVYYAYQLVQNFYHKAVTFETFKKMNFDIIISSIPAHDDAYANLLKKYQPQAKHISQMGNMWTQTNVQNVMLSVPAETSPEQNVVHYNQEFDLSVFKYTDPIVKDKIIAAFIHSLPLKDLFINFKHALPQFDFKEYGIGNKDGFLPLITDIANTMCKSTFGWMVKPNDGYGHILHNWLACGRPVITNINDYSHHRNILIPGETCIDIGNMKFDDVTKTIREYSNFETHLAMCRKTIEVFRREVNFGKDAEKIQAFLEVLK